MNREAKKDLDAMCKMCLVGSQNPEYSEEEKKLLGYCLMGTSDLVAKHYGLDQDQYLKDLVAEIVLGAYDDQQN